MTSPLTPPSTASLRLFVWSEWLLVLGLAATLAGTTLCLGGYLAATMAVTSWMVFGLAMLAGTLWLLGPGGQPRVLNRAALLPLPFLIYALASVLWLAPAQWLAWREWLLWLQMWLVFVLALHFGRSRCQTWVFVGTYVTLGLTGVVMAAYQRYVDPGWLMLGWINGWKQAEQFFGRSAGMFGIPNSLAGLLELMIPVCLALMVSRATTRAVKICGGGLTLLFGFAVVLTGSRGGWISLGLALMIWPLLGSRAWSRRLAGTAVIFLLAAAGLWALYRFSPPAQERIQPFLEGRFESSRPIIWKAGWQIWRAHPWFGSGAASYNVLFDQYRPRGFTNEPNWAHNDYLNTLSDYGVAGFALWLAAGAGLLGLGWRAVRRAQPTGAAGVDLFPVGLIPRSLLPLGRPAGRISTARSPWLQRAAGWSAGDPAHGFEMPRSSLRGSLLGSGPWALGLFVGLLAFALHLGVDFHTKLPALAFAAAIAAALLLRAEPELHQPLRLATARVLGLGLVGLSVLVAGWIAAPLYPAEAMRYVSRRAIDKNATTGLGDLQQIVPRALASFELAVKTDASNGQAWSDLSYATVQSWHVAKSDLAVLGRRAELHADQALARCAINAEFWVRKGVALDMQARRQDGETCFRRALELSPNSGAWWYYYAYHLRVFPERKTEALQAIETCLSLDPSLTVGIALRQQFVTPR